MKRFYEKVDILQTSRCYQVTLDNIPLKTPLKSTLQVPTRKLAEKLAKEWSDVETDIIPQQMPIFSLAVKAIDWVANQKTDLSEEIKQYIMNDLLCYRESEDTKLQEHQSKYWDPWLSWASIEFDFELKIANGVIPINQPQSNTTLLMQVISQMSIWNFMCFIRATTLTGSAILALAFIRKQLTPDTLFSVAYLDELYQIATWGEDGEAKARHVAVKNELHDLSDFLRLAEE